MTRPRASTPILQHASSSERSISRPRCTRDFGSGERNSERTRGRCLGRALEFGERQHFAIKIGQLLDQSDQVSRNLRLEGTRIRLVNVECELRFLVGDDGVPRSHAEALGDRTSSHAVHPGAKAFVVAELGQRALRPQEHVLHHIVHFRARHAPRYERAQALFELLVGATRVVRDHSALAPSTQQVTPQQACARAGFLA